MVGATAALAIGLHRRGGWQIVAVAAVAAISPDWDGLPFLFSIEWFDRVPRVWGHNLWAAALVVGSYFLAREHAGAPVAG